MLYGRLPFWGDSEEETINKIQNAPLKFDPEICITDECKEFMKAMLQKQADKRMELINLIQLPYFIIDDEELEQNIKEAEERHAV
jgi:Mg2+/Co2+ transporter CorB